MPLWQNTTRSTPGQASSDMSGHSAALQRDLWQGSLLRPCLRRYLSCWALPAMYAEGGHSVQMQEDIIPRHLPPGRVLEAHLYKSVPGLAQLRTPPVRSALLCGREEGDRAPGREAQEQGPEPRRHRSRTHLRPRLRETAQVRNARVPADLSPWPMPELSRRHLRRDQLRVREDRPPAAATLRDASTRVPLRLREAAAMWPPSNSAQLPPGGGPLSKVPFPGGEDVYLWEAEAEEPALLV